MASFTTSWTAALEMMGAAEKLTELDLRPALVMGVSRAGKPHIILIGITPEEAKKLINQFGESGSTSSNAPLFVTLEHATIIQEPKV